MDNENNMASDTVSGRQYNTRARCGGTAHRVESMELVPVEDGASGVSPRTAATRSIEDLTPTPQPTQSVSPTLDLGTTRAGQQRRRMKWTADLNTFIMRTYFEVTRLETDMTAYRLKLHNTFTSQFPHLQHITQQRVADQRRVIVSNNLLSPAILEQIREEVRTLLNIQENTETPQTISNESQENNTFTTQTDLPQDTEMDTTLTLEDDTYTTHIQLEFIRALTEFTGTNPTQRYTIPKQHTSTRFAKIIETLNTKILPKHIHSYTTFTELHTLIYCAALASVRCNGGQVQPTTNKNRQHTTHTPAWEARLKTRLEDIRRDLGRITLYTQGTRTKRLNNHINRLTKRHFQHSRHEEPNTTLPLIKDTLHQKLAVVVKRLKRYRKATDRKKQNAQFHNNEKLFYRTTLHTKPNTYNGTPTQTAVEAFWSDLWSRPVEHASNASWMATERSYTEHIQNMTYTDITTEDIENATKKLHNWKAPGTDNIQNFWIKHFTCTHGQFAQHFTTFIRHPHTIPTFLTQGITYLIPKTADTQDPSKYRPITCLNTTYKLLTSCLTNKIYEHCDTNNIITEEQKGCRRTSQGCKEQLIIDSVVMEQAQHSHRNIYTAYIDYKKAFDSVPHSWLQEVLSLYKIHPHYTNFLIHVMSTWKTTLALNINNTHIETSPIHIRRGIFQGDSLSPLWFCLALNPLSHMLSHSGCGFNIRHEKTTKHIISHLLYMDDLKLYSSKKDQLQHLLQMTSTFSDDIRMEFGIDKCRTLHITSGSRELVGFDLQDGTVMQPIEEGEHYKYLGFQQAQRIQHKITKETLKHQYINRLQKILKTQLDGSNTIKAINTYAVPLLTYSFGVIKWSNTDLDALGTKTRTLLTKHKIHHPKSAVERVTLPRSEGGRGLVDIKNLHHKQIHTLKTYFHEKRNTSTLHNAITLADKSFTPLHLTDNTAPQNTHPLVTQTDKLQAWSQKALHGRFPHELNQINVDRYASHAWLRDSGIFPETEGFMFAIQDQVIHTHNYRKHIIKDPTVTTDHCRRCHTQPETIQHITGSCSHLTQTDYKHRHDQVAKIIHQKLASKYKLTTDTSPYYKYTPQRILENTSHKLYWDRTIITDKTVHHNRPDITLIDKLNKHTFLIDIAVPNTHNMQNTYTLKHTKYTELAVELQRLWDMNNITVVPIIISSIGVIQTTLHENIKILDLHPNTYKQLQKAVIINTCHIVRKFLNINTENNTGRNNMIVTLQDYTNNSEQPATHSHESQTDFTEQQQQPQTLPELHTTSSTDTISSPIPAQKRRRRQDAVEVVEQLPPFTKRRTR